MHRLTEEDLQRAYRYALSLCDSRDAAFDLVHASIAAWLEQPPRAISDPLPYLLRSLRNRFIDDKRRAQRLEWAPLEEAERVIATDLSALEDSVIDADTLQHAWAQLSAAEREVLYLWAVEGYTLDEISRHTDTPRGTLLARLHRLRRRLGATPAQRAAGAGS